MKFVARFILITVLGYFLPFYLPWWSLMVLAFAVGYFIPGNGFLVFNAGFLGGGLVWLGLSLKLDLASGSALSEKMVQLFPFEDATMLIIISGLIGALIGGFSAIAGSSFRGIFLKRKKSSVYS